MNIIIPLGGKGQRFKDQDYKLPKILIPVLGKEIIFWVIESLKITKNDTITIIYNNELALEVEKMGYKGILAEGADHILGWRSPNFIYQPKGSKKIKLLLKNYKLSEYGCL